MKEPLDNLESLLELKLNRQQMTQNCEICGNEISSERSRKGHDTCGKHEEESE